MSGKTSVLSFMMNGLLDFGDETGISGFVGGGVGVARVKYSDWSINPTGRFMNDSDTGFAYQALAGIRANSRLWVGVAATLVIAIVLISAVLRNIPQSI